MLNENFRDMLCALNDASVEYLLVALTPQRIDILTSISGVEFAQAWNSRLLVKIDGMSVPVLGLHDLLTNKLSTGREKDLADIPTIKRLLG